MSRSRILRERREDVRPRIQRLPQNYLVVDFPITKNTVKIVTMRYGRIFLINASLYLKFKSRIITWIDLVGRLPLESPIGMLLSSQLCMLPGLVYNACQLELANILMLENVYGLKNVEVCLHFAA